MRIGASKQTDKSEFGGSSEPVIPSQCAHWLAMTGKSINSYLSNPRTIPSGAGQKRPHIFCARPGRPPCGPNSNLSNHRTIPSDTQRRNDNTPRSSRLGRRHCRPRLGRPPCGPNSNSLFPCVNPKRFFHSPLDKSVLTVYTVHIQ